MEMPRTLKFAAVAYVYFLAFTSVFTILASFYAVPQRLMDLLLTLLLLATGGLVALLVIYWRIFFSAPGQFFGTLARSVSSQWRRGVVSMVLVLSLCFVNSAGFTLAHTYTHSVIHSAPDIVRYEAIEKAAASKAGPQSKSLRDYLQEPEGILAFVSFLIYRLSLKLGTWAWDAVPNIQTDPKKSLVETVTGKPEMPKETQEWLLRYLISQGQPSPSPTPSR